jgi:hypothetical protein
MNRRGLFLRGGSARAKSLSVNFSKSGNCRNFAMSAQGRSDASARRLDNQWRELRRHVTIEKDSDKMFRLLTAELNQRRLLADAGDKGGNS